MQQYFIDKATHTNEIVELNEEQSHHMIHVLRMRQKDTIRIADASKQMFFASIEIQKQTVFAHILEPIEDHTKGRVEITLAQGLIKKEKWDFLLQKTAELGVDCILPFISSRTIVKNKEEKADKKQARYEKILLEACEQCKRSTLVELKPCISFQDLKQQSADLKLIAYEDADRQSDGLYDVLCQYEQIRSVLVVIGSEGGFSPDEVQELEQAGYLRVSLGSRILRAETAAMAAISNLGFFYDARGCDRH